MTFLRHIKWFFQRQIRGFDDRELWDLGPALIKYIYPRLKAFKKSDRCGYPSRFEKDAEWEAELDEIIWAFEMELKDEDPDHDAFRNHCFSCKHCKDDAKKDLIRREKAFEKFGKYLRLLWD